MKPADSKVYQQFAKLMEWADGARKLKIRTNADQPDQALARRSFLGGDSLSIGDIPLGCHVQLWMRLPIERPAHANLTRWFERLATRAPFRKIVDTPIS